MTNEKTGPVPEAPPGTVTVPAEGVFWHALMNPTVPKFYANTFSLVVHPTDLAILFGQAGIALGVVSLNYAVAKTLAARLGEAIASYEKTAGFTVPTAESLERNFRENPPKS
jgi:hypothetical protein